MNVWKAEKKNSLANQKVNVSHYKCLAGGESEPQKHVEITDGFSNRTWTAPGWDLPLSRDPLHLEPDLCDKGPCTLLVSFSTHSCLRTRRGTADNLTFIFNCQASPKWNRYLARQAHQPAFEAIRSIIPTLIKVKWASTVRSQPFYFLWVLRKHLWWRQAGGKVVRWLPHLGGGQ